MNTINEYTKITEQKILATDCDGHNIPPINNMNGFIYK